MQAVQNIIHPPVGDVYLDETLTEKADAEPGESAYLFNGTKCTVNGISIVLYGSYSAIEMEDGSFSETVELTEGTTYDNDPRTASWTVIVDPDGKVMDYKEGLLDGEPIE